MIWGAAIVAAGRGSRFGRPKQLVEVAGKPLIAWSIEAFASMPEILDLVIVTEPELIEQVETIARGCCGEMTLTIVTGGAERQDSVRAGLAAFPMRTSGVLIHDGARPLVRTQDVRAGMRVVRRGTGSLLATPAIDTIKVSDADGKIVRTLDRAHLWAAQTPQFGTLEDLRRAHRDAFAHHLTATDDATLLERAGLDVLIVEGSPDNFKVTVPADLVRAEALLRERSPVRDGEEEVLVVEGFMDAGAVDAVLHELERREARLDGIDRDLPSAVCVRAFISSSALRGFGERFAVLAGRDAVLTTHFSHFGPRTNYDERRHARAPES